VNEDSSRTSTAHSVPASGSTASFRWPKHGYRQVDPGDGTTPSWYSPHRAIIALGLILTLVAVAGGTLGAVNSARAERAITTVSDRYLVLQPPLREVLAAVGNFQIVAEAVFVGSTPDTALLTSAVADSNTTDATYLRLQRLLATPGDATLSPHLDAAMTAYVAARSDLGIYLAGAKPSAQSEHVAAVEQSAETKLSATLSALQATVTSLLSATAGQAKAAANAARVGLLWCLVLGVVFSVVVTALLARKALQIEHEWTRRDGVQRDLAKRTEFEGRLQRALEMAKTEIPVFELVGEALGVAAPELSGELLLADSSQAHFRQVLVSATGANEMGCGVVSPEDCPAAGRGQSLVFPLSTALDACPNLRGRGCSALCVPVNIGGSAVGVFHVTAVEGTPPSEHVRSNVEVVARRASERLAMLRAFELSQTQANSDSLTGLLTRRSLEREVRDLQDSGKFYCVAYGDLDHFKQLNDVYGHDAGDRALRTFSHVLRDSLRPTDIPSRYGGEEFVIVLPGCAIPEAKQVLERVMQRTAESLAAGEHPIFTVSFGLATSDQAPDFQAVVALADGALLQAKAGGRNEIIVAGADGPLVLVPSAPPSIEPATT
jgi:diguanylate cyclase (GGDEF)-like protein